MALWSSWRRGNAAATPRAAVQQAGSSVVINTPDELDRYIRDGSATKSGKSVTADTAMRVATVYGCVRIISGSVATLPLEIKRRVDEKTREDASDTPLGRLIRRRPNRWQKPSQFRRMLQAHVLLRGNAYCHIVRSRGEIRELIPLHPDRVKPKQNDDLSLEYQYTRPNGGVELFKQSEIFHLHGLTLDGVIGVTPITFARETIGLAIAMEEHGATTFKYGLRAGGVLEHPQKLGKDSRENLKSSLDEYRAGGESEGRFLILEEGMKPSQMAMTAEDAQWIESRKLSRSDLMMFFGVPPFMLGDTEKSTSWGSGIEQQKDGFVTFTLDDHLVMWEEGISIDLSDDERLYAKFNRNALVKGNIKDRWDAYTKGRRMKVLSANDVRALEDMNPVAGGDVYENPEITVPAETGEKPEDKEERDVDPEAA